jgi:hypothetical protein
MDLANMRKQGVQHLIAFCLNDACRHQALIDVSTGMRANPAGLSKVPEAVQTEASNAKFVCRWFVSGHRIHGGGQYSARWRCGDLSLVR